MCGGIKAWESTTRTARKLNDEIRYGRVIRLAAWSLEKFLQIGEFCKIIDTFDIIEVTQRDIQIHRELRNFLICDNDYYEHGLIIKIGYKIFHIFRRT